MKTRIAIVMTGIALACSGCNLVPASMADHGTAQATVTYRDDSGAQQSEVSVDSIHCDVTRGTGGFITLESDNGQAVLATVNEGSTLSLSMALGHDGLVFHATESVEASEDGVVFSDLPGGVAQTKGTEAIVVDEAATVTGTISCP